MVTVSSGCHKIVSKIPHVLEVNWDPLMWTLCWYSLNMFTKYIHGHAPIDRNGSNFWRGFCCNVIQTPSLVYDLAMYVFREPRLGYSNKQSEVFSLVVNYDLHVSRFWTDLHVIQFRQPIRITVIHIKYRWSF